MRLVVVLVAIGAVLAGVAVVLEPLLDDGSRPRPDREASAPVVAGPFAVAERGGLGGRGSAGVVVRRSTAELAQRLEADAAMPGRPQRAARLSDAARARRIVRSTCKGSNRDCRQAVASAAIRSIWASMPRRADPERKAERLLAFGARFALTPVEVRNSIRAELDEQLIRAVARGAIREPRRQAVITCFDTPARCALTGGDNGGPPA